MKYLEFKENDNTTELYIDGLKVIYFAGIPTICYDDGSFAYYNGKKPCYVGEFNGVYAHANTQEKADEMAKYWATVEEVDKSKLAEEIKKKGVISILEFKLLTNMYCEYTDKRIEKHTEKRIFTIQEALELSKINSEANEILTKYLT